MFFAAGCVLALILSAPANAAVVKIVKIVDANDGYTFTSDSLPSMNDSGVVSFTAIQGGATKIFSGTAGAVTTAVDLTAGGFVNPTQPYINNAGTIAFGAGDSVYLQPLGGGLTTYSPGLTGVRQVLLSRNATTPTVLSKSFLKDVVGGPTATFFATSVTGLSVASNGDLVASGTDSYPYFQTWVSAPPYGAAFRTPMDVITLTGFPTASQSTDVGIDDIPGGPLAINSKGTFIFSATFEDIHNGGPPPYIKQFGTIMVRNGVSSLLVPYGVNNLAINDHDIVIYDDAVTGLGPFRNSLGFFEDTPVTSASYDSRGFNAANMLAVHGFVNGVEGIYVIGVPEPTALAMGGISAMALLARRRRNCPS
jgi:hypothetical protein